MCLIKGQYSITMRNNLETLVDPQQDQKDQLIKWNLYEWVLYGHHFNLV